MEESALRVEGNECSAPPARGLEPGVLEIEKAAARAAALQRFLADYLAGFNKNFLVLLRNVEWGTLGDDLRRWQED
jgi:hypothetical protein